MRKHVVRAVFVLMFVKTLIAEGTESVGRGFLEIPFAA